MGKTRTPNEAADARIKADADRQLKEQNKREEDRAYWEKVNSAAAQAYIRSRIDAGEIMTFRKIGDPSSSPAKGAISLSGPPSAKFFEDGDYILEGKKTAYIMNVKSGPNGRQYSLKSQPEIDSLTTKSKIIAAVGVSLLLPVTAFLPHVFGDKLMEYDRIKIQTARSQFMDFAAMQGVQHFVLCFSDPYDPRVSYKQGEREKVAGTVLKNIDETIEMAMKKKLGLELDSNAYEWIRIKYGKHAEEKIQEYVDKIKAVNDNQKKHDLSAVAINQELEGLTKEMKDQEQADKNEFTYDPALFAANPAKDKNQQREDAMEIKIQHVDGNAANPHRDTEKQVDALLAEQAALDARIMRLNTVIEKLDAHQKKVEAVIKDPDIDGVTVGALRNASKSSVANQIAALKSERAEVHERQVALKAVADKLYAQLPQVNTLAGIPKTPAEVAMDKAQQIRIDKERLATPSGNLGKLDMAARANDLAVGAPIDNRINTIEAKEPALDADVDKRAKDDAHSPKFGRR